jgi:hypothetical protein
LDADEELEKLRTELASLYKLKANNDQQLIDAKNRLDQLERELRSTQMELVGFWVKHLLFFITIFLQIKAFAYLFTADATPLCTRWMC